MRWAGAHHRFYYSMEQALLLERGFNQPYVGGALKRFLGILEYWHKEYDPKRHNGRIIPILQSSACGKSRLVKELAKQVSGLLHLCCTNDLISLVNCFISSRNALLAFAFEIALIPRLVGLPVIWRLSISLIVTGMSTLR